MEPEQFECGSCGKEDAFLLSEKDFGTPNVVVPGWISWKPIIVKCPHCGEYSKFNCDWDKYLQVGEDTDWHYIARAEPPFPGEKVCKHMRKLFLSTDFKNEILF